MRRRPESRIPSSTTAFSCPPADAPRFRGMGGRRLSGSPGTWLRHSVAGSPGRSAESGSLSLRTADLASSYSPPRLAATQLLSAFQSCTVLFGRSLAFYWSSCFMVVRLRATCRRFSSRSLLAEGSARSIPRMDAFDHLPLGTSPFYRKAVTSHRIPRSR